MFAFSPHGILIFHFSMGSLEYLVSVSLDYWRWFREAPCHIFSPTTCLHLTSWLEWTSWSRASSGFSFYTGFLSFECWRPCILMLPSRFSSLLFRFDPVFLAFSERVSFTGFPLAVSSDFLTWFKLAAFWQAHCYIPLIQSRFNLKGVRMRPLGR